MNFTTKVDAAYIVPITRFDREEYIHSRVKKLDSGALGSLSTTLRYLYSGMGPTNLPADRFKVSAQYLDKAELILAKWLRTRTNGNLRKLYGKESLRAARSAKYRCQICGYPDVRALHLDHVEGRHKKLLFSCLCANCHNIKSREKDWTGKKPNG